METWCMLTRLAAGSHPDLEDYRTLSDRVSREIRQVCPQVRWIASYAITGPYDYLDLFEAPDMETAAKVSVLVRSLGRADTELWGAVPWARFEELIGVATAQRALLAR